MKIESRGVFATEPLIRLLATDSEAFVVGEALKTASGAVTKASGSDTVEYICMTAIAAGTGNYVQAIKILDDMVYRANLSATGTPLSIADKVTIASDGINITATTASGVCKITAFPSGSKASGEPVLFRI